MLVFGMTRSGKTQGFVLPTILANASCNNKPCFVITDPKNELYKLTSLYLEKHGYRIWKLDVTNPTNSNRLNPLDEI
ncbi:MAG: type IV secretory system conjugative DNA transfer family protein [Mycoplasmoidaceae bacterium]|nr:type IV secretory system conjugative DNA transfer family protein [Mycoplasmoidaceae bacterium]